MWPQGLCIVGSREKKTTAWEEGRRTGGLEMGTGEALLAFRTETPSSLAQHLNSNCSPLSGMTVSLCLSTSPALVSCVCLSLCVLLFSLSL